ncbi:MAG: RHS repeat-associated core domain-containing protein [bacterium]|nr:RHS repeat-associated core domain-containing protein [bacterium]
MFFSVISVFFFSTLINSCVYGYNKVHMKMFEQRGHDGNIGDVYDYDEVQRLKSVKFNAADPQNPAVVENSIIGNDILFQGRRYDKETNLYYYRARYYDPVMGRFLQTAPMGYHDSMNLYQAFNNNPIYFTDPKGLTRIPPQEGLINSIYYLKTNGRL